MDMTLKPSEMIDFTSLFHRDGCILKQVVGTTYSLHYETLLMLVLAIIYGPGSQRAMDRKADEISPAALLAAIRKVRKEKLLTVFCQADKTVLATNEDEKQLQTLLDFVKPVHMTKDEKLGFSSFHSKVWLIAFEKDEKDSKEKSFRLVVTSRNLTSNRDFDAVAVFESTKSGKTDVVDEIRRQVGALPPIFDEARFDTASYVLLDKLKKEITRNCHSIFSPFLDRKLLSELMMDRDHPVNIFSMEQEIYKLGNMNGGGHCNFYVLNPNMNDDTENGDDGKHFGLHAKLYVSDDFVILGSANFTHRGWSSNREFNVKIESGISAEDLKQNLGIGTPGGMFQSYQPPEIPLQEADDEEEEVLQNLACCSLEATYNKEGKLSLTVTYPAGWEPGRNVKIYWKPVRFGNIFFKTDKHDELCWENVEKKDVCQFFVCRVEINGMVAKEFQMLAEFKEGSEEVWNERFSTEKQKISMQDQIDYMMLSIEEPGDLYGRTVPLRDKKTGASEDKSVRMPHPPIFERLLELDDDQLNLFFSEEVEKSPEDPDPLGLYDALLEMKNFFGLVREKEERS